MTNPLSEPPPIAPALPRWLPYTLLAIVIVALFYRLLIGEVLFWGLPSLQFQPWRAFALSELHAGRLPLWNPFNGAGAPLFANYQSALLYPPNLIALLFDSPGVIGWLGMIHLFWAGLGMVLFMRQLGLPTLAQGVALLAYALNTAVVARFGTPPMVDVAAWLPWLILTIERLISRLTVRAMLRECLLLAAITAIQLLAGHAQWSFYSLLLAGCYTLFRVCIPIVAALSRQEKRARNSRAASIIPLVLIAFGVLLGAAMSAVQLVPTAELQSQSQRSAGAAESFALNFSYEWPALITQFNPFFFGNPGDGTYLIGGEYFETASYIGILPCVLALLTIGHYLRYRRRFDPDSIAISLIPFWALMTLIAFVFAFGRNSTLFVFLFRHMPTFNLFQAPARWLLLATFSLSALAGVGVSLWRPDRRSIARGRLALVGALTIAGVGAALLILSRGGPTTIPRGLLMLGLELAGVAIAFAWQPLQPARWRRWAVGLLLFVAVDMGWANALSNPTVPANFYDPLPSPPVSARTFIPDDTLNTIEFEHFLVFKDYRVAGAQQAAYRASGLPNMNMLDRQPSFNTFEPLRPDGIERFTALLNANPPPNLLAAAAIGTPANMSPPRAWVVPTLVHATDPFQGMADPTWQPYQTAFVERAAPSLAATWTSDANAVAHIDSETPLALHISVSVPGAAALIVADTWYPGWLATIDEAPTPIYRANGAFRALIVPAGSHQVVMRYEPESLRVGALLSGFALAIWLLLLGSIVIRPAIWERDLRRTNRKYP